ncbi:MAG: hypothetical protein ABEJ95_05845 [Candidatus Nanohalobium sp.]
MSMQQNRKMAAFEELQEFYPEFQSYSDMEELCREEYGMDAGKALEWFNSYDEPEPGRDNDIVFTENHSQETGGKEVKIAAGMIREGGDPADGFYFRGLVDSYEEDYSKEIVLEEKEVEPFRMEETPGQGRESVALGEYAESHGINPVKPKTEILQELFYRYQRKSPQSMQNTMGYDRFRENLEDIIDDL